MKLREEGATEIPRLQRNTAFVVNRGFGNRRWKLPCDTGISWKIYSVYFQVGKISFGRTFRKYISYMTIFVIRLQISVRKGTFISLDLAVSTLERDPENNAKEKCSFLACVLAETSDVPLEVTRPAND